MIADDDPLQQLAREAGAAHRAAQRSLHYVVVAMLVFMAVSWYVSTRVASNSVPRNSPCSSATQ